MASVTRTSPGRSAGPLLLRLVLLILVAGLALTGCTEADPGQAVAAGQNTTGQPPGGSGQPTAKIPPRPRDINLEGQDPCKLLSKTQADQIKVTRQRNLTQTESTFKGSPICAMDGSEGTANFEYNLWLVTTEGIEPWLGGKRNADAKLVSVDGFPAASYKIRGTTNFNCWTSVGVANNQQLMMEFQPTTRGVFSQEQMCQKSEQAATFAMQTLKTLK
jgi:hypothetical protein